MDADSRDHFIRGLYLSEQGRERQARAEFEAGLPGCGDACRLELALLDIRGRRDLSGALKVARTIIARSGGDPALRARALHVAGLAHGKLRRNRDAVRSLLEAQDLYRELGDGIALARVQDTLASVQASLGRLEAAAGLYAMSLVRKVMAGDQVGMALTLGNLGRLQLRAGRFEDALECFRIDQELAGRLGDARGQARMLLDQGRALLALDRHEEAEKTLVEGRTLAAENGLADLEFFAWKDLAVLRLRAGRIREAEEAFGYARDMLTGTGEPYLSSILLAVEAELLLARNDPAGLPLLARAVREFADAELPDQEIPCLLQLAEAQARLRRKAGAEACLRRAQLLARREGQARYLPSIREAFGRLALVQGAVDEEGRLAVAGGRPVTTKDGYTILRRLGSGAFGEVHAALDPVAHEVVAIKRLRLDGLYDQRERRRVLAGARIELEAASRIRHAGIARVLALGTDDTGGAYLVQEFIEGECLRDTMKGGRPDRDQVLKVAHDIALALAALHEQGIVHRDVKPENIMLRSADGRPVLLDLGIARLPRQVSGATEGFLAGTLAYMAPEQARCETVSGRTDVWALGVVLYEWLAGVLPLDLPRDDFATSLERVRHARPRPLPAAWPAAPEDLAALVDAILTPDPDARPVATGVAAACRHLLAGQPFQVGVLLESA